MKNKAFTLHETLITLMIIGIIAVIIFSTLKPKSFNHATLKKAGQAMYIQIDYATTQIIAKHTTNYTLKRIKNGANEFSIANSGNTATLVNNYYKKRIKQARNFSLPDEYKNLVLKNENQTVVAQNLKVSSFTGFKTKNNGYFAVRLHNNCTTSETYLYNPSMPSKRNQTNSCGQIFFDVNSEEDPNLLGIDQFLISLKENGVR